MSFLPCRCLCLFRPVAGGLISPVSHGLLHWGTVCSGVVLCIRQLCGGVWIWPLFRPSNPRCVEICALWIASCGCKVCSGSRFSSVGFVSVFPCLVPAAKFRCFILGYSHRGASDSRPVREDIRSVSPVSIPARRVSLPGMTACLPCRRLCVSFRPRCRDLS